MTRHLLALIFALVLLLPATARAQANKPNPIASSPPSQYFIVQDHQVVFRKGDQAIVLTKNVVLSSGVRINYKSGIVEFPDGKNAVLKEGDIVKLSGEIVPGSPILQASDTTLPAPTTAKRAPASPLAGPTPAAPAAAPAKPRN